MTIKNIVIILLLLFAFISCKNNSDKRTERSGPGKNEMVELNRYFVQKDRERIINFIERKNLKMKESPTGLWYQIIRNGEGNTFTDNNKVIFDFECSLLDGTKCYSSKELGVKEVVLGKSQMEAGLNEGLRMLNHGAEAVFIIPPFLAYGLIGDGKKIPSRAIIVYNVNILRSK
ncbi:MAG: FKBP-type peptidyl-prolyl cis-trans isomerase [Bacteroidales bacterium]|nr:FKBP-type peptidyl-prolyl cis-trans isomerase [Bacteroidales bacterium]